MEEGKIPEKIAPTNVQKTDYYTTRNRKAIDFLLGFVGFIVFYSLITTSLNRMMPDNNYGAFSFFIILAIVILSIIFFKKIGRRYIASGILAVGLIPLIILGGCMLVLSGGKF